MHHFCLGFTFIALIFCIHLAVLQSYLSLFSHIICIHFAKLGTQLDWLIFWAMYFLVYAIFMCELHKIFFLRDMLDNQCANIFSTHAIVYGHIVSCLHLLKERIFFFICILNLVFKFGLCLFTFPLLLNFSQNCFSQNLFCFSYFYRRRSLFLTFVVHKGCCLYFL